MTDAIGHYLVEIIKSGGPLALWGIFIWPGLGIVRLSVICLATYLVVRIICKTISDNYKINKETKCQRISLLSEELGRQIGSTLTSFSKECSDILKDLEKLLKDSKTESNKT